MFTRRGLFKLFAMGSLFIASTGRRSVAGGLFKPKKKLPARIQPNRFVENNNALVGVSWGRGTAPLDMVKDAVSFIGGFERLAVKGKTVLVKPNVVSGERNPATTNPEVVGAVVRLLYGHEAKKVYVGDMSAFLTLSTLWNMKKNGIYNAARDNGAEVVVFEDYDWVEVELDRTRHIKSAYVTEWLYNVDLIVNLPVIKTHRNATYSITLKNFIGCTHLSQRPYIVDESHWEEIVSELNLAYAPDINIVDGTVSMIEGGPWEGTGAKTNLIIASADRIGADIVGLGIIKSHNKWKPVMDKDLWEEKQIKTALSLGIGKGRDGLKLVVGSGDKGFNELMKKTRAYVGF